MHDRVIATVALRRSRQSRAECLYVVTEVFCNCVIWFRNSFHNEILKGTIAEERDKQPGVQ